MNPTTLRGLAACMICIAPAAFAKAEPDTTPASSREAIGQVLGTPVYRDQLRLNDPDADAASEMRRLFVTPLLQDYKERHAEQLKPTNAEVAALLRFTAENHAERMRDVEPVLTDELTAVKGELAKDDLAAEQRRRLEVQKRVLEERLERPSEMFAQFMLRNWKLQRHLYQRFGGGRVLWQQAGIEAFDATRKWIESAETAGDFAVTGRQLRDALYHYWTMQNYGAFLTDDPQRVRDSLTAPPWLAASTEKEKPTAAGDSP